MSSSIQTSAGHSINDLKELVKRDQIASADLQARIEQLRQDMKDGKRLPKKRLDLMEVSNKDMTKDLVSRIEEIEATETTATDREMLQALNARLTVCDVQAMQLAELRELEHEARNKQRDLFEDDAWAKMKAASRTAMPGTAEKQIEDAARGVKHVSSTHLVDNRHSVHYSSDEDEDDDESDDDISIESVADMSSWPAPYRVLGINPETPDDEIDDLIEKSIAALAAKHDPRRRPNDPEAPRRWAMIEKCRDLLMTVEKRRFLDNQRQLPLELEGLDIAELSLD